MVEDGYTFNPRTKDRLQMRDANKLFITKSPIEMTHEATIKRQWMLEEIEREKKRQFILNFDNMLKEKA